MVRIKQVPRRVKNGCRYLDAVDVQRIVLIRRKFIDEHDTVFLLCDAILRKGVHPYNRATNVLVDEFKAFQNDCITKWTRIQLHRRMIKLSKFDVRYEWRYPDNGSFESSVLDKIKE